MILVDDRRTRRKVSSWVSYSKSCRCCAATNQRMRFSEPAKNKTGDEDHSKKSGNNIRFPYTRKRELADSHSANVPLRENRSAISPC